MKNQSSIKKLGILPKQAIRQLYERGHIKADAPFLPGQTQPASLDLRLGARAYRVRASFLPGPELCVADKLARYCLHEIDLTHGAVLETGCVYIAPLQEALALPEMLSAAANPKSSTGRLDVFTRLIADKARSFDQTPQGYQGPLYLEISPRTFPIVVRAGSRLSQLRFRAGEARLSDEALQELHQSQTLVANGAPYIREGLSLSIDLAPQDKAKPVGYRAKRHSGVIDVDRPAAYDVLDFWEPIYGNKSQELILDPDQFYILVSCEAVHVPPDFSAEMVPFDPMVGEFRVHYAGFFDPGFGHAHDAQGRLTGSRAVLEVRSHEVPFILEHGQMIGRLIYEPMCERPDALYGADLKSHYQGQALKLSKHFRA